MLFRAFNCNHFARMLPRDSVWCFWYFHCAYFSRVPFLSFGTMQQQKRQIIIYGISMRNRALDENIFKLHSKERKDKKKNASFKKSFAFCFSFDAQQSIWTKSKETKWFARKKDILSIWQQRDLLIEQNKIQKRQTLLQLSKKAQYSISNALFSRQTQRWSCAAEKSWSSFIKL